MNSEKPKPEILLVEDDASLRFVIQDNLEQHHFAITSSENGIEALQIFQKQHFDLCILDVMLPEMDGFTLAGHIRQLNKQIPVLFLTARGMKEDKLKAFQLGADDYIVKPFSIEELIMRMQVFLRRNGGPDGTHPGKPSLVLNSYLFDYSNLCLIRENMTKALTQKEADILHFLCQHIEKVVRREDILNQVWGNDDYFTGRSLDVFISKIRKYLALDPAVQIINYHGIGFKLSCNDASRS
ncbi:MAG: response regulator transcription factor [Bacteroidia bacterium]|jgi:DNA-binding response OmpR family regulator